MGTLKEYLRRLIKHWWSKVALASGVIGAITKYSPLPPSWGPLITWIMIAAFVVGFVAANFLLFREQKREIAAVAERLKALEDSQANERYFASLNIQKLVQELVDNLGKVEMFPIGIQDDAWDAFPTDRLAFIPDSVRETLLTCYQNLRTLREMGSTDGAFSVPHRDQLRMWMNNHGKLLINDLSRLIMSLREPGLHSPKE
jgi:hypothetical protein